SQSSRGRGRLVRRREVADPGARPLGAGAAADAGGACATEPRLPPPRHHQPLRRARRRLGPGDRGDDAAASRRGVPPLPQPDRQLGAGAPRRARRARQLVDPQNTVDPALAPPPPALHAPLHTDLQPLAQPRRALTVAAGPPARAAPGSLLAAEAPDEDRDLRAAGDTRTGARLLLDDEPVPALIRRRSVQDDDAEAGRAEVARGRRLILADDV